MSTPHVERSRSHYGSDDILQALHDAGLKRGDIVFFTTSLGMLGKAVGVFSPDDLNRLYYECIMETLGPEGTALVPTYSYTFGRSMASRKMVFDPDATPAEIGPFPNFFRLQPGVVRSLDPMTSICGLGPAAGDLFADLPPTSYGADSVFARLTRTNAKCCSIGLGPNWTPFIHHADWLARVPFRFDKLFTGILRTRDAAGHVQERDMDWLYSVPILSKPGEANAHRLGQKATEAGIWRHAPLGRARVYVAGYQDYFDFAIEQLAVDPWTQAIGPPCSVLDIENGRVGSRPFPLVLDRSGDIAALYDALLPVPRYTVSDGYDAALAAVAGLGPSLDIKSTATGTNHFDWIVPEKWTCRQAQLRDADGQVVLDGIAQPRHLFPYAQGFSREVDADELALHLQVRGAPPLFEQNFMVRDWAFRCSPEETAFLGAGPFAVNIVVERSYGEMRIGQFVLPGRSDGNVLLVTHLDETAGYESLSGVLAAREAVTRLAAVPGRQTGLIFLIVPSTVGLAAWMDINRDCLQAISAGLTVRGIGGDGPMVLQQARTSGGKLEESIVTSLCVHDSSTMIVPSMSYWNEYALGRNPVAKPDSAWGAVPMMTLARPGLTASGAIRGRALGTAAALLEDVLKRALGVSA